MLIQVLHQLERSLCIFENLIIFVDSGMKDVLKKRLKDYYKRQNVAHINRKLTENEKTKYDYLVVIDFEATCNENNEEFVHEIIEFPAVLVDTQSQTVVGISSESLYIILSLYITDEVIRFYVLFIFYV